MHYICFLKHFSIHKNALEQKIYDCHSGGLVTSVNHIRISALSLWERGQKITNTGLVTFSKVCCITKALYTMFLGQDEQKKQRSGDGHGDVLNIKDSGPSVGVVF